MTAIQDQVVCITGASSGIGEACAQVFARAGAKLLLAARRLDRLTALADQLKQSHNSQIHCISLDVSDRPQVETALSQLPVLSQKHSSDKRSASFALP
jgi:serine 3-dehydrogenase